MNLNIVPNGAIKRVHVSQNDVGRTLTFELFNNSTSYTIPIGATVKIQGTKPSGLGFSETCTVSGNVATVDTTEEMTDEYGYIDTELQISYSGNVIGTSNFVLAVERNPHPDGTVDGTGDNPVIKNLEVIITNAVDDWLDEHPEATTTVVDGSLTEAKFSNPLKLKTIKDYVTPQMYGAVGDGVTDDTNAIQTAVNSGRLVYLPKAEYLINGTIVLSTYESQFICDGTLIASDSSPIIQIANSHITLSVEKLQSSSSGVGIAIEFKQDVYYEHTSIMIGFASNFDVVLKLNGNSGIQYSNIAFKRIQGTTCIWFNCENGGWVNDNVFAGGRMAGGIGIKFNYASGQDPYNGNKFYNIGFEGFTNCLVAFKYAQKNVFENCRMIASENSINSNVLVTAENNSTNNVFRNSSSMPINNYSVTDSTSSILLYGYILDSSGVTLSYNSAKLYSDRIVYSDDVPRMDVTAYNNTRAVTDEWEKQLFTIGADTGHTATIKLYSDRFGNHAETVPNIGTVYVSNGVNSFFLKTGYAGGTIQILDANDNVLADNVTLKNIEGGSLYFCYKLGSASWKFEQIVSRFIRNATPTTLHHIEEGFDATNLRQYTRYFINETDFYQLAKSESGLSYSKTIGGVYTSLWTK